jgi:hypothetical protein
MTTRYRSKPIEENGITPLEVKAALVTCLGCGVVILAFVL